MRRSIFFVILFLSLPAYLGAATDNTCLNNCFQKGLGGYQYCRQACSYESAPAPDLSAPIWGFIQGLEAGRRAVQEENMMRLEQELLRSRINQKELKEDAYELCLKQARHDSKTSNIPEYIFSLSCLLKDAPYDKNPVPPPPPSYLYTYDENGDWNGFKVWDFVRKEYAFFPFSKEEKEELNECKRAELKPLLESRNLTPEERLQKYDEYIKALEHGTLLPTPCKEKEERIENVMKNIAHSYQAQEDPVPVILIPVEEKKSDIFDKIEGRP